MIHLVLAIIPFSTAEASVGVWQWDVAKSSCDFKVEVTTGLFLTEAKKRGKNCSARTPAPGRTIIECLTPVHESFYFFDSKASCLAAKKALNDQEYAVSCAGTKCSCAGKTDVTLKTLKDSIEREQTTCELNEAKSFMILECHGDRGEEFHFGAKTEGGCLDAAKFAEKLRKTMTPKKGP